VSVFTRKFELILSRLLRLLLTCWYIVFGPRRRRSLGRKRGDGLGIKNLFCETGVLLLHLYIY